MDKRAFLEGFLTASTVAFGGHFMWRRVNNAGPVLVSREAASAIAQANQQLIPESPSERLAASPEYELVEISKEIPIPAPAIKVDNGFDIARLTDAQVESYLKKIRNFDAIFASDIFLDPRYETLLIKTARHLKRVESYIGHGNFNLLTFDEMIQFGKDFSRIGPFESDELNFIEEIFFANPNRYGFYGEKITGDLTDAIPRNSVEKIANTGHFLLKGESLNLYDQIKRDVGNEVILTSGVRSIVKQMHLFLAKSIEANGNLSRASRSLAPPGHSYHGIGDFDIGKIGYGERNFTSDFSDTAEYKRIAELGYVDIRYPSDNLFGVRFEPWHIKIG